MRVTFDNSTSYYYSTLLVEFVLNNYMNKKFYIGAWLDSLNNIDLDTLNCMMGSFRYAIESEEDSLDILAVATYAFALENGMRNKEELTPASLFKNTSEVEAYASSFATIVSMESLKRKGYIELHSTLFVSRDSEMSITITPKGEEYYKNIRLNS